MPIRKNLVILVVIHQSFIQKKNQRKGISPALPHTLYLQIHSKNEVLILYESLNDLQEIPKNWPYNNEFRENLIEGYNLEHQLGVIEGY